MAALIPALPQLGFSWTARADFSGLLGGHAMARTLQAKGGMRWYRDQLLDMAVDLADRLVPAFNTSSGLPLPRVSSALCRACVPVSCDARGTDHASAGSAEAMSSL